MLVMGARGATGYVLGRGAGSAAAFSPLSLSPALWLDASQITGLSDGAAVATWTDASGNDRHVTQSTPAAKPTYKTGVIGGKPVLRFDGGDWLSRTALSLPSPVSSTIFFVAKQASTGSFRTIMEIANYWRCVYQYPPASLVRNLNFVGWPDANTTTIAPSVGIDDARLQTDFVIVALRYDGNAANSAGSYVAAVNGGSATVQQGSAGSDLGRSSGVGIGARSTGAGFWTGDIAEIIVYASALSDANRQAVEAYLSAKYSIVLA